MASTEREVLTRATELHPDSVLTENLRELMPVVEDPDLLIETAIGEGLAGLLYKNLLHADAFHVLGEDQGETLESFYYNTLRFNLRLIRDIGEILRRLNEKGIEVVLLQGIILLKQVYKDPGLRPMTDMDLWVPESHYPSFAAIIKDLGYREDPLYPLTFRREQTTLDIHTGLLGADRIRTRQQLFSRSQEDIYRETLSIQYEGENARCLGRYDQVLYLCLHALKHNVDYLIGLVDIKHLVLGWDRREWNEFMGRAGDLGQARAVRYVFFLLDRIFGFQPAVGDGWLWEWERLSFLEKKALRMKVGKGIFPPWAAFLLFAPERGLRHRLFFLFESLFPRPEILRQVFPDSPGLTVPQLYIRRAFQIFARVLSPLRNRLAGLFSVRQTRS
jgi:putative nucleotidyltransferase-like protein